MTEPFYAIGMDISINHGALVVLDESGNLLSTHYLCQKAKDAKKSLGGERVVQRENRKSEKEDKHAFHIRRLRWLRDWYDKRLGEIHLSLPLKSKTAHDGQIYIGLEDFAYDKSQGSHQIGEVAGLVRLAVTDRPRCHLRLHSPTAIKYFAVEKGSADKDEMREAVMRRWGVDFDAAGPESGGDLYDAYAIAQLIRLEVLIRRGEVELRSLSEVQLKTFLRVTKTFPVNLLDRPWITG